MIEGTSRRMKCTLLTSNYSQMPAVALQAEIKFYKLEEVMHQVFLHLNI